MDVFMPRVLVTGSIASFLSTIGLAWLARFEGKAAVQPINATSHWLHDEDAGEVRTINLPHTGVGYGTHDLSALFWAVPLTLLVGERRIGPQDCREQSGDQRVCRRL